MPRTLFAAFVLAGLALIIAAGEAGSGPASASPVAIQASAAMAQASSATTQASPANASASAATGRIRSAAVPGPRDEVVQQYCVRCHNERRLLGNLSLEDFDAADPASNAPVAEKMIRKLRAGMMPPPGARRPAPDVLVDLAVALEDGIDADAARRPNPGRRSFQRLNRAEYARAVQDLLGLEIDASAFLPGETLSAGFDNVADVQHLSATLLEAYMRAASQVARLALGDARATPSETTYEVSRYAEQRSHVPGAPFGTRGGISVVHNFPADGEYLFRLAFQHESTGNFFGQTAPFDEHVEISVDGLRVALIPMDRWMHRQDPNGMELKAGPVRVAAGPRRVSAAFLKLADGPVEDLVSPHEWSLADKKIGYSYGITGLAHLRDMAIGGPYDATGVTPSPASRRVMVCRPAEPAEELACARRVAKDLAIRAFRRPVASSEVDDLMELFEQGAAEGGFAVGVRTILQGVLASPDFIFRFEPQPPGVRPGDVYEIGGPALASRLSFFLWGRPPDAELAGVASAGRLAEPGLFEEQLDRMLADPRAEALGSRFASQWLRLQDLDKVHPDALRFPDFHAQLASDMRRETEMFFHGLVAEGGTLWDLLSADYSYMNERLARHYGIPGVAGPHFRKVRYVRSERRGLLGHGSILTLTSHANRTSPVLRGKWVMEVLLGTPPPPPPADVPDLDATADADAGRFLTVREKLEAHRSNPACSSCHRVIDPVGLALENFDVTGAWRIRDRGNLVETTGELYDGSPIEGPEDLRTALLGRKESLARSFAENLLAYALGRRVEYYDMPVVRRVARAAADDDYRLSAFVREVARSDPFRLARAEAAAGASPDREPF